MEGSSLAVKKGLSTPQPKPRSTVQVFPINNLQSDLLSREQLKAVWSLLPDRVASITPTLAYSSDQHGTSLTTFYNRVGKWEPSILVVREAGDQVFGAYCSTSWDQRNQVDDKGMRQTYFGTGECFLFRVTSGGVEHYPWVQPHSDEEDQGDKGSRRARELFMSGDNKMVTVGGGGGTGLYLDADLRFGRTETCQTFQNPPLCSSSDFTVSVVEAFGITDVSW